MMNIDNLLNRAIQLHRIGKLLEARGLYEQIVDKSPANVQALNLLGATYVQAGEYQKGLSFIKKAISIKQDFLEAYNNLGIALKGLNQYDEAIACYRKALALKPGHVAYFNLGNILKELNRHDEAIDCYRKALALKPDYADAYNNLGIILKELKRNEEAVACYRKALAIKPDYADAYKNLGNILVELKQHEEAITCYRKALAIRPDVADMYNSVGNVLGEMLRYEEAAASYRKALALKPDYAEAYNNLGNVLKELKCYEDALACYQKALAIKPDYAEVYNNLGNILSEVMRHDEGIACYQKALEIKPDNAITYYNLGGALSGVRRHEEAAASFAKLLSLKPDFVFAIGMYLHSKMHCCSWEGLDDITHELLSGIDAGKTVSTPFPLLAIPSTPAQQKRCAEIFIRERHPAVQTSQGMVKRAPHNKIRLGYFSCDYYNHATSYLIASLLERHDRSRFEVFGFSYGASRSDDMRQRVSAAFDRFLDVGSQSDRDIAALAKSLEIDIAVDLKGFTEGFRTGIFALRPAPIQVNYLGFPGTMGAPYIDYLIADQTLIPVEHQQHYSEKIAYLPYSYQVNDSGKAISERQSTRSEAGLPDEGFIFCCFNNNFKITPAIFDIWMQLLKQVEGSVLWLIEGNAQAKQNLQNEAMKRGIAPGRIVYAERMDLPDHLARHRLADLFLDTFFYNAHTTASDALWAGLPVLTYLGDTFAGRVAASLLNAIGLPELITHSHEEYKALALELATNPEKLNSIKQQLAKNRITHPLFNTALFTRHIEDAYIQMWERQQESLLPDHIYVGAT